MPILESPASTSTSQVFGDLCKALLRQGRSVRFRAPGRSMYPTIRDHDVITVEPIEPSQVKVGDIVLYSDGKGVVAHRVARVVPQAKLLSGCPGSRDSSRTPHPVFLFCDDTWATERVPVAGDRILGRVVGVERKGRVFDPYRNRARLRLLIHRAGSRLKRLFRSSDLTASGMTKAERTILAHVSDLDPDPDTTRFLLSSNVNTDRLIEGAVQEGLAGFLYKALMKSESLGFFIPSQRDLLESAYYRTVRSNLILIRDLKEVLCALNRRAIPVVLLQGMDLLHGLYEDIGLRPLTDIDMWLRTEDYPAAVDLLGNLAYRRDAVYPQTFRKGSTTLDLHTHLLWADRIRARKRLLNREAGEVFARTRPVSVEGEKAYCLHPDDQFIYLSLHALKHRVNRFVWLVDLKTLAGGWEASEWRSLLGRARELGQEKTVCCIFYLLQRLFQLRLPDTLGVIPHLGLINRHILRRRIQREALSAWGSALLFASAGGIPKSLPLLFESLFPRPDVLRQVFPDSTRHNAIGLYFKRAVQLLGMLRRG